MPRPLPTDRPSVPRRLVLAASPVQRPPLPHPHQQHSSSSNLPSSVLSVSSSRTSATANFTPAPQKTCSPCLTPGAPLSRPGGCCSSLGTAPGPPDTERKRKAWAGPVTSRSRGPQSGSTPQEGRHTCAHVQRTADPRTRLHSPSSTHSGGVGLWPRLQQDHSVWTPWGAAPPGRPGAVSVLKGCWPSWGPVRGVDTLSRADGQLGEGWKTSGPGAS